MVLYVPGDGTANLRFDTSSKSEILKYNSIQPYLAFLFMAMLDFGVIALKFLVYLSGEGTLDFSFCSSVSQSLCLPYNFAAGALFVVHKMGWHFVA